MRKRNRERWRVGDREKYIERGKKARIRKIDSHRRKREMSNLLEVKRDMENWKNDEYRRAPDI